MLRSEPGGLHRISSRRGIGKDTAVDLYSLKRGNGFAHARYACKVHEKYQQQFFAPEFIAAFFASSLAGTKISSTEPSQAPLSQFLDRRCIILPVIISVTVTLLLLPIVRLRQF